MATDQGAGFRWPLMGIVLLLFWRTRLHLVNTELVRAWAYPDQGEIWQPVHLGKVSSWALLVIISFIVVTERRVHGRLKRAA